MSSTWLIWVGNALEHSGGDWCMQTKLNQWYQMMCGCLAVSHPGIEKLKFLNASDNSFPISSGEFAGAHGNRSSAILMFDLKIHTSFTSVPFNASIWVYEWMNEELGGTFGRILTSFCSTSGRHLANDNTPGPYLKNMLMLSQNQIEISKHGPPNPQETTTRKKLFWELCVLNRSCCIFLLVVLLHWDGCAAVMRALTWSGLSTVRGLWCMVASSKVLMAVGSWCSLSLSLSPAPSVLYLM